MPNMTKGNFQADATAKGYADPVEKSWEAGLVNDDHTHDFDLYLLVTQGEMTLEITGSDGIKTVTCALGDTIEVAGDVRHTERVGAGGVTFLVARRPA